MPSGYRDRVYDTYLSSRSTTGFEGELDSRRAYLRRLIAKHFPSDRNAAVLDLGCGSGALVYYAREAGYRQIWGIDRSKEQISLARARGLTGIREGDLFETLRQISDQSQDCVVSLDVLEHFTKDEAIQIVDDVARILRPGGKWIIHVPNGEGLFGARIRYADFTHELAFTSDSLRQLLCSSGFREVTCYEDAPIPHGAKSALRWFFWKAIRLILRFYVAVETGDTGRDMVFTQNLLAVALR